MVGIGRGTCVLLSRTACISRMHLRVYAVNSPERSLGISAGTYASACAAARYMYLRAPLPQALSNALASSTRFCPRIPPWSSYTGQVSRGDGAYTYLRRLSQTQVKAPRDQASRLRFHAAGYQSRTPTEGLELQRRYVFGS